MHETSVIKISSAVFAIALQTILVFAITRVLSMPVNERTQLTKFTLRFSIFGISANVLAQLINVFITVSGAAGILLLGLGLTLLFGATTFVSAADI